MGATIVALGSPSVILALLVVERAVLRRLHRKVLVRITVLGTRGKSRVARLVAFELRADGRRVADKTTGHLRVLGT
jgi:folylpolyglutamate synthase/dihydropteroate synthase